MTIGKLLAKAVESERQNRVDKARRLYTAVLEKDRSISTGFMDAVHNSVGNALIGLGRPEEAILHFQKAISFRSGFAEAHNNLGTAFDAASYPERAIACLRTAAALDAAYADPHANLGAI